MASYTSDYDPFYKVYSDDGVEYKRYISLVDFNTLNQEILLNVMLGTPFTRVQNMIYHAKNILNRADETDIFPWDQEQCNKLLSFAKEAACEKDAERIMHCNAEIHRILMNEKLPLDYKKFKEFIDNSKRNINIITQLIQIMNN